MPEEFKRIVRYLILFFIIMATFPTTDAVKNTEDLLSSKASPSNSKDSDSFFQRGLSHQRLTKDIIQTIGRGLLDPGVISFLGPLLMAGLVALPFLAPSAIIPLAGLMSSVRGRRRRDLEESIGEFVVKELPDIINRVISKNQMGKKGGTKPITLDDIQRKLEDVIQNKDARKNDFLGSDPFFKDKRFSQTTNIIRH